ncbi:MAG TPA: hypothetical protein PL155_08320 [Candidatus Omnitrophota bacterium]|nr:hypothetical protein [Candidatus Omnitrophota bacterium]HPD85163.1 hypothetical protein [Candidatus Omnitrophota bacterium]HRZ04336.1 hypothetical protein [Candidatus Omnitrophota bacterium]
MEYICDVCRKKISGDPLKFISHTEEHIVDIIKERHPDWVKENGICPKCLEHYKKQLKG